MARSDYMPCDRCDGKAYYDVGTDYGYAHVTALCDECSQEWIIVLKPRPKDNDA